MITTISCINSLYASAFLCICTREQDHRLHLYECMHLLHKDQLVLTPPVHIPSTCAMLQEWFCVCLVISSTLLCSAYLRHERGKLTTFVVHSYYRIIVLSYYRTIVLLYYRTIVLILYIVLSYYCTIILLYYHTIVLSYYRTIVLSYYCTIVLLYYRTIVLRADLGNCGWGGGSSSPLVEGRSTQRGGGGGMGRGGGG